MNKSPARQNLDMPLTNEDNCATIVVIQTQDVALAKQLANHHLALAQAYFKLAGEKPIQTGSQMRKMVINANR